MRHKRLVAILILILLILIGSTLFFAVRVAAPEPKDAKSSTPKAKTAPVFDKKRYSVTDPSSIWVIINKQHAVSPINYAPADLAIPDVPLRYPGNETMKLRSEAAKALEIMFADAHSADLHMMLVSGYRSYNAQVGVYQGYVNKSGQAAADTFSARPGYSEHQTGFAVDIAPYSKTCELEQCFGETPEGKWVAANAYKYGFIIRYKSENQSVTGYDYEPWHLRYIGVDLAAELQKQSVSSLEQFFDISGGSEYK